MTKEAKIGMLTGLGVIVAIGVLLSEYLGDRNTGPTAVPVATGKMATLPTGAAYRQQVMTPVNVPAMTPAGGGERTQLPGGGEVASPVAGNNGAIPTMYAAQPEGPTGPNVTGPVTPVVAGPTLMDGRSGGGPPILTLADQQVAVRLSTPAPKVQLLTYTILPGDNLGKIAKKYYNSSKNSDIARIVAANPGTLKDAGTMLVANKKLLIPVMASAAAVAPAGPRAVDPGVVGMPGGSGAVPIPGVIQPPKPALTGASGVVPAVHNQTAEGSKPVKTYTVQNGDSLEKIAKTLTPTKVSETVSKLVSLNGLKDASKLKVGQVLKLPA